MIHVIFGPKFSGKTEELLDIYKERYKAMPGQTKLFVPSSNHQKILSIDKKKKGIANLKTCGGKKYKARILNTPKELIGYKNIFIDDAYLLPLPFLQQIFSLSFDREIFVTILKEFPSGEQIASSAYLLQKAGSAWVRTNTCELCGADGHCSGSIDPDQYENAEQIGTGEVGMCFQCWKVAQDMTGIEP